MNTNARFIDGFVWTAFQAKKDSRRRAHGVSDQFGILDYLLNQEHLDIFEEIVRWLLANVEGGR